MNLEPSNPSEGASENICHEIMTRLFPQGRGQEKRYSPSGKSLGNADIGTVSTKEIVEANRERKIDRSDPDILGKLSHQMSSASILRNIYFQVTRWCAGPVRVWYVG